MPGLDYMDNQSSGKNSISEFLSAVHDAAAAEKASIEELNKIKITNVQNLGALQRQQEAKLVQDYTKVRLAAAYKENQNAEKSLKARHKQQLADQAALNDADFKAKYGFDKKRLSSQMAADKKRLEAETKARTKQAEKEAKEEIKRAKRKATQESIAANKQAASDLLKSGASMGDRLDAAKKLFSREVKDENGNVIGSRKANPLEAIASLGNVLSDMAKQLDNTINTVANYKGAIDTRLQGLNRSTGGLFGGGSYWDNISTKITGIAGVSPFLKQSALAERVNTMVAQGIAFNVEQRAVLQELSGKIATTFDAANGTLLRLVRIQQQDTTAGRLGMESALTAFLNNMYQTTEYMSNVATSIKGSLEEAMSLMSGENALSFEYQVQKWLGSLYSVGMSDTAVQGLGNVLGKLASGQIDAITSGGQGNLVVMAANRAGLSVADLLNNGLTQQTTNDLMNAMVEYLAKIAADAGDSKVIQQQMASVYGMTASDLRAAVNLARSAGVVGRNGLDYGGAMRQLNNMAGSIYKRTSIGEMMTNAWENLKYTMGAGIANNPALFAMYKAAGLLDTAAGGIAIPAFSVMGNMVDLETTVADLLRAGAMGGSILAGIGTMIASGGGGGITGTGILRAAGINNGISTVSRGSGNGLITTGGASVSESGLVGNANGGDVSNSTMTSARDEGNAQLASAVEESDETKLKEVYSEVVNIYHLLQSIADGVHTIPVEIQNASIKVESDRGV